MVEPGGAPIAPGEAHANHDPEVVAALLDRDLTAAERDAAARQVASCASCAALLADLRLLASATVALPTPERTRDFRLTPADVTALREPAAATSRQTGDMTDTRDHSTHDTLLVAALADRTIGAADRDRAEALVARCGLCAALRDDMVAIRSATRALPTPPRRRDYRLAADDASRLRPGGWRRLVAALRSSWDVTRPLAVGLTTLGLAGLLVATVPSILNGSVPLGPSSGAAALPESNAAGGGTSSGGQVSSGAGGSSGAGAAAALPAAGSTVGEAASPAFPAPEASGITVPLRAAAPPSSAAAVAAPPSSAAAVAAPLSSAAASGPVFDVITASPEATPQPVVAALAPTPSPVDKGAQGSVQPPQAAVAASPPATSEATSDFSAQRQPTDDRLAVESGGSGPSALVLISGALLLAGLGLFAIRRLGRRPLD